MNRDFKGVWIPREIWQDKELSAIEKVLLVEIDSLDKDLKLGCFASTKYLADFIQKSEGRTANVLTSLRKRGYLITVFRDGRKRGMRVNLKQKSRKRENRHPENVNNENGKADLPFSGKVVHENGKSSSRKREHTNTVSNTGNNTHYKEGADADIFSPESISDYDEQAENIPDLVLPIGNEKEKEVPAQKEKKSLREIEKIALDYLRGEGIEDWKYAAGNYVGTDAQKENEVGICIANMEKKGRHSRLQQIYTHPATIISELRMWYSNQYAKQRGVKSLQKDTENGKTTAKDIMPDEQLARVYQKLKIQSSQGVGFDLSQY